MAYCTIALGSNLGDRRHHLTGGLRQIAAHPGINVIVVSNIYETAPVGGPDNQGPYLNAALSADVALEPETLLAALQAIELLHGRARDVVWGPRTLDLDILTYGDRVIDTPALRVPHPLMATRRFVMVPLCDIAADLVHPELGEPMAVLCDRLPVVAGDLAIFEQQLSPVA